MHVCALSKVISTRAQIQFACQFGLELSPRQHFLRFAPGMDCCHGPWPKFSAFSAAGSAVVWRLGWLWQLHHMTSTILWYDVLLFHPRPANRFGQACDTILQIHVIYVSDIIGNLWWNHMKSMNLIESVWSHRFDMTGGPFGGPGPESPQKSDKPNKRTVKFTACRATAGRATSLLRRKLPSILAFSTSDRERRPSWNKPSFFLFLSPDVYSQVSVSISASHFYILMTI